MNGRTGPSWELLAHHLTQFNASDAELADRLGCFPARVAKVRAELGMRPFPRRLVRCADSVAERFAANVVRLADGHARWDGRCTRDGTPLFSAYESALRVAFRLTHGQEPEGRVRVECVYPHCVDGSHLSDRVMRSRAGGAS